LSTIYLPIEVVKRELVARAFLSVKLADNGNTVYIFEHTFFDRNGWPDKGVYIGKNCFRTEVPYSKFFYSKMKMAGISLWYLDEEGGIYIGDKGDWEERLLYRINPDDLNHEDKILVWGKWQKRVFDSKETMAEVLISGIPNFDILNPKYQQSLIEWDSKVTQGKKDYILINTRFSLGNSKIGINKIFNSDQPHSKNLPEFYLENVYISDNQIMFKMIELCIFIAKSLPDEKIIIRPHPGENPEIYKALTKKIKNISVVINGGVESWIRMSKVLIHNGCSTAIQAIIAEKKVITYLPKDMSKMQIQYTPELPNTVGTISHTYEEVLSAINDSSSSSNDDTWKDTVSELNSIDFISKLIHENTVSKGIGSNDFYNSSLFIGEKLRDNARKVLNYVVPDIKNKKFNHKELSQIVDLVEIAKKHYKSDVKCKKITNGCYCVYK
jgi:surface carbohydrate biosynthesis protein